MVLSKLNSLVEFLSTFLEYNSENFRCSQGILKSTDGKLFLIQDYTASPSSTAELILGGSKNGWDYWKDSNGISINESLR